VDVRAVLGRLDRVRAHPVAEVVGGGGCPPVGVVAG
jgi:hypothetical protein